MKNKAVEPVDEPDRGPVGPLPVIVIPRRSGTLVTLVTNLLPEEIYMSVSEIVRQFG